MNVGVHVYRFANFTGNLTNGTENATTDPCADIMEFLQGTHVLLTERFYFVVVLGSFVALVGIVLDIFLFFVFVLSPLRNTSCIYLAALCVFDIMIFINYETLISVGLIKDYSNHYDIHLIWHKYVREMLALSRITQTAQTFLLIAATTERFMLTVLVDKYKMSCRTNVRLLTIFFVSLFAVVTRLVSYWELLVFLRPECEGFADRYADADLNGIFADPVYAKYKLYIEPVIMTYMPFILLLILNGLVTYKLYTGLKATNHNSGEIRNEDLDSAAQLQRPRYKNRRPRESRSDVRDATMTLMAIVTAYLISNFLNLWITLMEQTDPNYFRDKMSVLMITSDISSFLVITTSALRLPIYYYCNRAVRKEIKKLMERIVKPRRLSRKFLVFQNNGVTSPKNTPMLMPAPMQRLDTNVTNETMLNSTETINEVKQKNDVIGAFELFAGDLKLIDEFDDEEDEML